MGLYNCVYIYVCGHVHTKAVILLKPETVANARMQIPNNYNKIFAQCRKDNSKFSFS